MERKEQGQEMSKKLFTNWGIKLISLLIAFGLWFAVVYLEDPPEEETFVNIPVQFVNTELLTDQDLVYEVLDNTDVVKRVTVRGPKTVVSAMRSEGKNSIVAIADFANKNMSDVIAIEFQAVTEYSGSITDIVPAEGSGELKLFVEEKDTKNVNVKVETKGQVADGYQLGTAKSEQNRITITGGKSKVEQVSYAAVTVDISGSSSDITTSEVIQLYDKDGNRLDSSIVQKSAERTLASITVLATKTVPVIFETTGEVAEGYRITGEIESSIQEIKIAGSESVLNSVNNIVVPAAVLDVTGLTEDYTEDINLRSYLPSGVQVARDVTNTTATVKITVEQEIEQTLKMMSGNVNIINVPDDITFETAQDHEIYDVPVVGLERDLDSIDEAKLEAVVDVGAWLEAENIDIDTLHGTYYIPAEVELPEGVFTTAPVEIRISFTEQEELLE